uniref:Uncharacterized protein n=1 Tax=Oryza rufipogon TaxID=4529 RepID=A0A0E0NXM6_ORYRU
MANYLRFNIFDLNLSQVHINSNLQRLLIDMSNRSILVIEDIDCCFDANPREHHHKTSPPAFQTKRGKLVYPWVDTLTGARLVGPVKET